MALIVSPAIFTVPLSTFSSPASTMSSVDLPEPDGPTTPTDCPLAISREIFLRTWTEEAACPRVRSMFSRMIIGALACSVTRISSYMNIRTRARHKFGLVLRRLLQRSSCAACPQFLKYGSLMMRFKHSNPVLTFSRHFIVGFCALILAVAAAKAEEPTGLGDALPTEQLSQIKIVGFGDSLMAGYLLPGNAGFPQQLETALHEKGFNVTVENAGVSG